MSLTASALHSGGAPESNTHVILLTVALVQHGWKRTGALENSGMSRAGSIRRAESMPHVKYVRHLDHHRAGSLHSGRGSLLVLVDLETDGTDVPARCINAAGCVNTT
jgi:hypothetical protein